MPPPIICGNCHCAGHRSLQCPSRSDASISTTSSVGSTSASEPPSPCWWCGAMHQANECPTRQERQAGKCCLLCGKDDHWIKACPKYEDFSKKRDAAISERKGHSAAASGKPTLWCMREGSRDHATLRCKLSSPPIILPKGEDAEELKSICLWCGIRGHDWVDCLQRCPSRLKEHGNDFISLKSDVARLSP